MKNTFSQLELFVVCNLLGSPNFLFNMKTVDEAHLSVEKNKIHNDENTQYAFMPVYHYMQTLCGGYKTLIDAYNSYNSDYNSL